MDLCCRMNADPGYLVVLPQGDWRSSRGHSGSSSGHSKCPEACPIVCTRCVFLCRRCPAEVRHGCSAGRGRRPIARGPALRSVAGIRAPCILCAAPCPLPPSPPPPSPTMIRPQPHDFPCPPKVCQVASARMRLAKTVGLACCTAVSQPKQAGVVADGWTYMGGETPRRRACQHASPTRAQ